MHTLKICRGENPARFAPNNFLFGTFCLETAFSVSTTESGDSALILLMIETVEFFNLDILC